MVDPGEAGKAECNLDFWPVDVTLREMAHSEKSLCRKEAPIEVFTVKMREKNEHLRRLGSSPLIEEEFFAARLYTGPLYCKYNVVLRFKGAGEKVKEHVRKDFDELCSGNLYATTLHVINSAIVK